MTGELADCFPTRRQGVAAILAQLAEAVGEAALRVYAVGGQWLDAQQAIAAPWQVAASNWHALAHWLCRWEATRAYCERAVLVDIGSTTVDIIPLEHGAVATTAATDRERLARGQLVYTGLGRTPVCAVVQTLCVGDTEVPVMAEWFATVDDAYLTLGLVPECPTDCESADGRPRTAPFARSRLARMVGEDAETLSDCELDALATQVLDAQAFQVAEALSYNWKPGTPLLISGHGSPLACRVLALLEPTSPVIWLHDLLDTEAVRCAPAVAVARLWAESLLRS
jgi:(4-(4-[2-(gamma-L-glutamylamino)ethyl]phenoxymethyl)furan-2-yl)methanamine synthase